MGGGGNQQTSNEHVNTSMVSLQVHQQNEWASMKGPTSKLVLFSLVTEAFPADQQQQQRNPIDLAIVLDRSGSMSGPKLENSKLAIKRVIENLLPEDRVHVVVYGSDVATVIENGNLAHREALYKQVDAIKTSGMTNMSGGLNVGIKLLNEYAKPKSTAAQEHRVKRIFLFSDGLVNEGPVKDKDGMFKLVSDCRNTHQITTSAFGIGEDFDEAMMQGIAEHGSGNYFFIDTPDNIDKWVGGALKGLLGLIGRETKLQIKPSAGVVVEVIYNYKSTSEAAINDLKASNTKNTLVRLAIDPSKCGSKAEVGSALDLLSYKLTYVPNSTDTKAAAVLAVIEGQVQCKWTAEAKAAEEMTNDQVASAFTIQKAADIDEEVARNLSKNDVKGAIAAKKKEVELWTEHSKRDKSTKTAQMQTVATNALLQMEREGASETVKKQINYHSKLKRCDSEDYLDLME